MKKFALILAAAALLVGCGSTSSNTAEPKTTTKTVTVSAAPVTKTVTKTVTPQSCLDAIDDSERISMIVVQFSHTISVYPQMVGDAFKAGLQGDTALADDVLGRMKQATAENERENGLMTAAVRRFNADKADCRSH